MRRLIYIIRQTIYTLFAFCYFLVMALEFTLYGFVLITLGGATDEHKLMFHKRLCRRQNM